MMVGHARGYVGYLVVFGARRFVVHSPFVCAANLRLGRITGHAEDLVCRNR